MPTAIYTAKDGTKARISFETDAQLQEAIAALEGPQQQAAPAAPPDVLTGRDPFAKNYGRQTEQSGLGNAAARMLTKGISAPPLLAMDLGVALRNVGGNIGRKALGMEPTADYELPSSMFNRELDARTTPPQELAGKVAEFGGSAAVGAGMPVPQVASVDKLTGQLAKVPQNFANAGRAIKNQILEKAQKSDLVVPPSANNPSFMNRLLEGIGGKIKLQQEAAMRNQPAVEALAAKGVGQSGTAPVTQGALATIRSEAHAAGYEPLRQLGKIATDAKYADELSGITQAAAGAARSFPGIKPQGQIDEIVGALKQKEFDAGDGLDAISHLRSLADDAYSAGNKSLGKAYKTASKAIEDMLERALAARGKEGADMLKAYRDARQLMAKTYTAGKAIVDESGSVAAGKYAAELGKNKPLTGEQRLIAEFARQFPKAVLPKNAVNEIYPSISPLDAYGSVIAAGAAESAAPLAIPLTRVGLREYLLSGAGQKRGLLPQIEEIERMGLLGAFPAAGQAGLFGQ